MNNALVVLRSSPKVQFYLSFLLKSCSTSHLYLNPLSFIIVFMMIVKILNNFLTFSISLSFFTPFSISTF